jgi:hypothetical protein
VAAGCGGSAATKATKPAVKPQLRTVRQALVARLEQKQLDFRWVACVRNGRTYRDLPIVRCNVNFGDPHIEVYCAVLDHGRLVTNHENSAVPCRRDGGGSAVPIQGS